MKKVKRGLSDSIVVLILVVVAVTLTLTVSLLGFTLFKSYGSQSYVYVKGVPTLSENGGVLVLNLTLESMGTTTIRVESISVGNLVNTTTFVLPAGSTTALHVEFQGQGTSVLNSTLVKVTITTSSQLEPVIYTYAQVQG
ncbi:MULTISPECIES: hypothetical protein [Metallosphaera]|uniref:DUF973 family protein n=1 Tax=Metallosphaera prunae TaxID=47304 RepID=A0A4D8S5P7_METPR|nr:MULTISPECIES: hypothetical protein [Metallosphaera]QCO30882.1 hypothetical protein DFR88_10635 [Metallosphaera prunae]BBL47648.1 hypothetical protein MJ1HA_1749 [Metallosphaera sedula]